MQNVILSNSQLNKLISGIKYGTQVALNLSSNVVGDSNNEINFPHKLLLADTKVSKICKFFGNGSSANIKFPKTQLLKISQLGGEVICEISIFASILLNLAEKGADIARDVRKNFIDKQIARFKKEYITGKGSETTLRNDEIKEIMKGIRSLENRGMLLKGILKN